MSTTKCGYHWWISAKQCFKLTASFYNGLPPEALIILEFAIDVKMGEIIVLRWLFPRFNIVFALTWIFSLTTYSPVVSTQYHCHIWFYNTVYLGELSMNYILTLDFFKQSFLIIRTGCFILQRSWILSPHSKCALWSWQLHWISVTYQVRSTPFTATLYTALSFAYIMSQ